MERSKLRHGDVEPDSRARAELDDCLTYSSYYSTSCRRAWREGDPRPAIRRGYDRLMTDRQSVTTSYKRQIVLPGGAPVCHVPIVHLSRQLPVVPRCFAGDDRCRSGPISLRRTSRVAGLPTTTAQQLSTIPRFASVAENLHRTVARARDTRLYFR